MMPPVKSTELPTIQGSTFRGLLCDKWKLLSMLDFVQLLKENAVYKCCSLLFYH